MKTFLFIILLAMISVVDCTELHVSPTQTYTTIQSAITASSAGDTILVAPGTYYEHLTINKNLAIYGDDAILDGSLSGRCILIDAGKSLVLSGFAIRNGSSPSGAGIRNNGNLDAEDVSIVDNHATYGGGVLNAGDATFENCLLSENTVSSEGDGGAIYNAGDLDLIDTELSENTAPNGAGICNAATGDVLLDNANISNNAATYGGGGIYNWGEVNQIGGKIDYNTARSGAGVYSDGGSSFTMNGSISHNTGYWYGGGIYTWGLFIMNGGSISYNTVTNNLGSGGGIYNDAQDYHETLGTAYLNAGSIDHNTAIYGGAIYDDNFATTYCNGTLITHNTAGIGGAVFHDRSSMLVIDGSTLSYNNANSGGAIYSDEANVTLISGSIDHNNATVFNGGGIFMDVSPDREFEGTLKLLGGSIDHNTAAMMGGGVMNAWNTIIRTGGTITNNVAGEMGGAIYWSNFVFSGMSGNSPDNVAP
jgi:predicted outer membrane repeat protein